MPSDDLLGRVLASVSRNTGSAAVLDPVWRQIAGEVVAQAAAPSRWMGTVLVIGCRSAAWANELGQQRHEWLARLQRRLGASTVTGLLFEAR